MGDYLFHFSHLTSRGIRRAAKAHHFSIKKFTNLCGLNTKKFFYLLWDSISEKKQMENNIVDSCFDSVSYIVVVKKSSVQTSAMFIFKLSPTDKLYCSTLESAHRLGSELEMFPQKLGRNYHFLREYYQKGIHNVQDCLFLFIL